MNVNDDLAEAYYRRFKLNLSGILESYSEDEAFAYVDGITAGLQFAIQIACEFYEKEFMK